MAEGGFADIAELLLAKGAEVRAKDIYGKTPLDWAAAADAPAVAKLLLAKGADPNAKDNRGRTPLHAAAYSGSKEVSELLLAAGADVNAADACGWTPLHWAVWEGHADVVNLLLAQAARVKVRDQNGNTPIDDASRLGRTSLYKLLKSKALSVSLGARHFFTFRDVGDETGVTPLLSNSYVHAAAWGDVAGTGWFDLYVGNFQRRGSKPNMLLRNDHGKFRLDDQPQLRIAARSSGAVFADFDNKGRPDLFVSNLAQSTSGSYGKPSCLFRNDGGGRFTDISATCGACLPRFAGRSVTVLDFDGDGRLDILQGESLFYDTHKRSRLFRNLGGRSFEDVSDAAGLPPGVPGLGVACGDVNNDGWPDIFLTSIQGDNRLFLNDGHGGFREAPGTREVFNASWDSRSSEDMTAGVCFADVNNDGLLDIVIGQHYTSPWRRPVAVRLYLNRGIKNGNAVFEDVTEAAGLHPLPMKAPHVEVQDFDNDGWPDIYLSVVKFAGGKPTR